MLSASSLPYIEASVPVLRAHGGEISKVFYRNLFDSHPELTQLFNMGNQAAGTQQQALAAALFAYAANIHNTDALGPVINRIVHKHASVGVCPAHYPIVGQFLIGAIKEVLGDAATPPLLNAWDEAYWLLARQFIAAEKKLYDANGLQPGDLRQMKVLSKTATSDEVSTFTLGCMDGSPAGPFIPGQYISVVATLPTGQSQQRQYSLSDAQGLAHWRISVKRVTQQDAAPAGEVSNWLYKNIHPGDILLVSSPFGDFTPALNKTTPIALLSAGVGITPMISVLNTLAQSKCPRSILFAHATRHGATHAHIEDVKAAKNKLPGMVMHTFYENPRPHDRLEIDYTQQGRMRLDPAVITAFSEGFFYLCGPHAFMQVQWKNLIAAGVSPHHIQREVFGPDLLEQLA
ncbi:MAG: flavohemoprotein [Ottowia sp.]|nr:flavohemoprotein [Ottowia sp.]